MKRERVKQILKEQSGRFGGYSDALVNASRAGLRRRVLQKLPVALREREAFDVLQKEDIQKLLRYKYKAKDLQALTQEVSGKVRRMLRESGIDAPTQETLQTITDAIMRKETEDMPLQGIYDLIKSHSSSAHPDEDETHIPDYTTEDMTTSDISTSDGSDNSDRSLESLLPPDLKHEAGRHGLTLNESRQITRLENNADDLSNADILPPDLGGKPDASAGKDTSDILPPDIGGKPDTAGKDTSDILPPELKPIPELEPELIPATIETLLPDKLKDEARAEEDSLQTPARRHRMPIEVVSEEEEKSPAVDFSAFHTPFPAPATPSEATLLLTPEQVEEVKALLPDSLKFEADELGTTVGTPAKAEAEADPDTLRKEARKSAKKDKAKAVRVKKMKDLETALENLAVNDYGSVLAPKTKDERVSEILRQYKAEKGTKKNPTKEKLLEYFRASHQPE